MGIETLAIGALVGTAVSSVGSIFAGVKGAEGAQKKADAETAAYEYKAQVAQNNAIIAKRNADQATASGQIGAQSNDLKTKNLVASQLVAQASSGLDVNSGTAVDVRQSAADLGHLDTLTILHNAAKNSAGFKAQGMNFEAEAGLDKKAGAYAQVAGDINATTSLLGGATSFADKWTGYAMKAS